MTRDEIIRMARETNMALGFTQGIAVMTHDNLHHFAALVAALIKDQMIRDGWRQCAEGQKTTQFCAQLEAAVEAEREAILAACDMLWKSRGGYQASSELMQLMNWIRARGEK